MLTKCAAMVILQKHIDFLIDRHAWFSVLAEKPDNFGELFSTEWTRSAMSAVVRKGAGHLTEVCILYASIFLVHDLKPTEPHALGLAARLGAPSFGRNP
jgi:hypothetical protein